jgi:hypothetical protein
MNAPVEPTVWIDANQKLLVAELTRIKSLIGGDRADGPAHAETIAAAAAAMPWPAAIDQLASVFGLSPFERDILLLCAGVELDSQVAAACRMRGASFAVALAAFAPPHWSALTPHRPLRRWRMVEVEPGATLVSAPLRIDERILHFLAGINMPDVRLQSLLNMRPPPRLMAGSQQALSDAIVAALLRWGAPHWPAVQLAGGDPHGAEDIAAAVAARLRLQLHVLRVEDTPTSAVEIDSFVTLWEREAALLPAALLIQCGDSVPSDQARSLAERLSSPLLIAARDGISLRRKALIYDVRKPSAAEQKWLWSMAIGAAADGCEAALDGVADQFRLSAQAILAAGPAVGEHMAAGESLSKAVHRICRSNGRRALDDLAECVPAAATWDDLVLPEPQLAVLRQIAAQVRRRRRVYDDWGFGRCNAGGLGVAALFCGGSGTGKTLAAEVLACALDLDLYRIDLSSVVSKYIGETEKNLRRIFDAADDSGAILLFDEADALFGKRSDVKDSHDRYANIEVSYLLQRMEAYRGLAILTSNMKDALDSAFLRRLRFVVDFPFPNAADRAAIWARIFPAATPTEWLDFDRLAQLNLPGGNIRNIALYAAFLAAEAREPVGMAHLLHAARREYGKLEKSLTQSEIRGWSNEG